VPISPSRCRDLNEIHDFRVEVLKRMTFDQAKTIRLLCESSFPKEPSLPSIDELQVAVPRAPRKFEIIEPAHPPAPAHPSAHPNHSFRHLLVMFNLKIANLLAHFTHSFALHNVLNIKDSKSKAVRTLICSTSSKLTQQSAAIIQPPTP
jgi:hypothetical protein